MIGTGLERSLQMVTQRLYKLRVLRRQALCWLLLLVPGIALVMLLPANSGRLPINLMVLLAITVAGLVLSRWKLPQPTAIEAARLIEKNRPELNDAVLTAVRASETLRTQRNASVLNEQVIYEADRLARISDWRSVVPGREMLLWSALSFLTFGFLITGVVAAGRWGRELPVVGMPAEVSGSVATIGQTDIVVDPGDVQLEQGSPLTVVARFGRVLPTDVVLQLRSDSETTVWVVEPTVDEGVFAVRIPHVDRDGTYCVAFGNSSQELAGIDRADFRNKSPDFQIQTFVRPRLRQADVRVTPPEYTGKQPLLVEDTVRVTVVEGSQVQFMLHLNKPVAVAELRGKDQTAVSLLPMDDAEGDSGSVTVAATVEALEDQKYTLYLEDADGRTSPDEVTLSLKVTRNQRPKIKVTFPGRDTSVSPLQEFQIEAQATDDFGLTEYGVIYTLSGQAAQEISLWQAAVKTESTEPNSAAVAGETSQAAVTSVKLQHMIEMESLKAAPDELLSYCFYVEDSAADGSVRRTHSDMMFAEVRRFEEIFRESQQQQSQQQQQQQQQQGNQTEKLMELQRQIMVATWNVQRSLEESRSRESAVRSAVQDVDVVRQSQLQALELLEEVRAAAEEPSMQEIVAGVERDMQRTVQSLQEFIDQQLESSLPDAFTAEQSAFAGLMRLRAKEHEVTRSQSSSGSGQGQNSASQEQLRQLELDNDRNRYESEKQAQQQQQQGAEQQEQLQILNRLKELARRQQMLNERLKQLESELRTAETQEEKDEIERELKRLRDEQREMLRDVDELRETMDQQSTEQQQRNQESREQVEQARERVQEASRAMDEGRLAEAISEGTRAERQFEQMQEEFRNQTSSQFSEAMRDLRQQARQMNERQEQIAKELSGESDSAEQSANPTKPSLRGDRDRERLQQQVAEQRDDLERVLEQAKSLVEEAEQSEPLLSRRLYDTIRETRDRKPEEALEATEILVSRGLWNQGQQAEQIAREGIEELSKGIEKAADAVLGSEAESLRRAQAEIEDLAQQLSSEIAQATGQPGAEAGESEANREAGSQGAQDAGDENSERAGRAPSPSGEQQRGESQRGESQDEASRAGSPGKGAAGQSESQEDQPRAGGEPSEGGDNRQGQSPQQDSENPPGENSAGSSQPGQPPGQESQQGAEQGQQPGQQSSGGQGQGQGQQQQPDQQSQSQPGQGPGQGEPSESSSESGGQSSSEQARSQSGSRNGGGQGSLLMSGGRETSGGRAASQGRPLTGEEFREWSNRLREVEEVLNDPELSQQVAQVRDRARSIRAEFRRHGTEPQWDLVKSQLLDEMTSLQKRIQQELAKLSSDRSMVPIDREPVPEEFDELVRRYYELLGQNREESR